ncbi:hypothetical protein BDR07DRAFT_1480919 [Suillus spraguei]|nr:hypothetical protein BDR07DRAFT_1480919 [Suillus spraguei]
MDVPHQNYGGRETLSSFSQNVAETAFYSLFLILIGLCISGKAVAHVGKC